MRKSAAYFAAILGALVFGLSTPTAVLAVTTPSATLSFDPLNGTFNRGCSVAVNVMVNTGTTAGSVAQTDGTDAIIKYDPAIFTVTTTSIQNGTIYSDYPGNSVDPTGKIAISGLASVSQAFSGTGVLATINFTVKADAPTQATNLTFDFDPNDPTKTTDSNVVERQTVQDVLRTVNNAQYTIGTGNCSSQTGTTNTPTQTGTVTTPAKVGGATVPVTKTIPATPAALVKTGDATSTFIFIVAGSALTILGILGLALL